MQEQARPRKAAGGEAKTRKRTRKWEEHAATTGHRVCRAVVLSTRIVCLIDQSHSRLPLTSSRAFMRWRHRPSCSSHAHIIAPRALSVCSAQIHFSLDSSRPVPF